ncbi:DUF1269 domain-containing protein [Sphaerotilus sp.]|uniref:DUF1269 domain-containing protein n=1 Tax=Sphaerotilus sp. TaxID=2093942 RepID=UPI00286DA9A4|nr:DUF1269 domain-containing protein [Sphaerotilus sp.]
MRRRLYWLLPDLVSARRTMDDLLLARIAEEHLHFVGRESADMSGLHVANVLQTSDVVKAAEWGVGIGAVLGAATGVSLGWLDLFGAAPPSAVLVVVMGIAGALFGAWASSMIGVSVPSERIKRFAPAVEAGQILMMVDVPRSRVEEIEQRLKSLHPEAHLEGLEPNIPAFP